MFAPKQLVDALTDRHGQKRVNWSGKFNWVPLLECTKHLCACLVTNKWGIKSFWHQRKIIHHQKLRIHHLSHQAMNLITILSLLRGTQIMMMNTKERP